MVNEAVKPPGLEPKRDDRPTLFKTFSHKHKLPDMHVPRVLRRLNLGVDGGL